MTVRLTETVAIHYDLRIGLVSWGITLGTWYKCRQIKRRNQPMFLKHSSIEAFYTQQCESETMLWLSVVIPCCNEVDWLAERDAENPESPTKKASHGRLT